MPEFDPSRDLVVPTERFATKSIDLHFLPVVQPREDGDPSWVTLVAFVDVTPVGYISLDNTTGAVDLVIVDESVRRHGVGSVLITQAKRLAAERGWPEPWFDSDRSEAGDGLARSQGEPGVSSPPPWEAMSGEYYFWRADRWRAWGWLRDDRGE